MIKDISRRNAEFPLGRFSISAETLINIIEEMNFTDVKANNKGIELENIEDMRRHKSALAGWPSLQCDKVSVSTYRGGARVSVNWDANDSDVAIARSLAEEIKRKKTITEYICDNVLLIWLMWMTSSISVMAFQAIYSDKISKIEIYYNIYYVLIGIMITLTLTLAWSFYLDMMRPKIFHRPTEGFWTRNFEKIVLAIVSGFIGAVIAYIANKVSGKVP